MAAEAVENASIRLKIDSFEFSSSFRFTFNIQIAFDNDAIWWLKPIKLWMLCICTCCFCACYFRYRVSLGSKTENDKGNKEKCGNWVNFHLFVLDKKKEKKIKSRLSEMKKEYSRLCPGNSMGIIFFENFIYKFSLIYSQSHKANIDLSICWLWMK